MDAFGNVLEDEVLFTAITIANRNTHAFLSCSSKLMVANQSAHAFRPNSTIAKTPIPLVDAMTKMMLAYSASCTLRTCYPFHFV